jgi:predicted amidohydrolase
MKIFCCQMDIAWENKRDNHARAKKMIATANPPNGSLVVLPEMFATGFSMNVPAIVDAGELESSTTAFLAETAREFGIYLMGGLVTPGAKGRGLNQAAIFSPEGAEIARYSKCQPFTLGGESQQYQAGRDIVTFRWQNCLVAPFICYDLRFPELFRAAVRREAEVFIVIASWPVKRIGHWVTLLQARAIENQAYVVGVNRTGTDPSFTYTGRSLIVNPHGDVLADAGSGEGVISAEIDLQALKAWRAEFPALQDMRTGESWRATLG